MSMLFKKELMTNSQNKMAMEAQYKELVARREMANNQELALHAMMKQSGMAVNQAARIPQDVWRFMDDVTVTEFRSDEGDVILNDVMGQAKSIHFGKIKYEYRQASDAGNYTRHLTGQAPILGDKVDYTYESSIVPVHSSAFRRSYREALSFQSEGFDAMVDDQRETVRTLRQNVVDYMLNGGTETFNGTTYNGIFGDANTIQIDLGTGGQNFDFTSSSETGADIRANFKTLRDAIMITNNIVAPITFYVSREILSNFERFYSDDSGSQVTILNELRRLEQVGAIKQTSILSGNSIIAMPLDQRYFMPVSGMALSTEMVTRLRWNDDFIYDNWMALGFIVKSDFQGRSGVLYATTDNPNA